MRMSNKSLNTKIIKSIANMQEKQKIKILDFIEYLQMQENHAFIDYINDRTQQAIESRKKGKRFTSLEELQKDYV